MRRESTVKSAPPIQSQKLKRLRRGNATSFAPSMTGRTKLPSAAGMLGMITRKTMIAPCSVNQML